MLAVDTNVVVRLFISDHEGQHAKSRGLFERHRIWVPVSVILESEWVMRRAFRFAPSDIAASLRSLVNLEGVEVQSASCVSQALDWFEQGMDFADALHLALARDCAGLATFDRDFIKAAARIGAGTVAEP